MRLSTAVKGGTGMGVLVGAAVAVMLVLQSVEYALYMVGAVALCVGALLVVLEPELRGRRHP